MRKGVTTYQELGPLRMVWRKDLWDQVRAQYPHAYVKHANNDQMTWYENQRVKITTQPVLVAHAYARMTKEKNGLWYFQMPSKPKPTPQTKKTVKIGFKLHLNLRLQKDK